MILNKLLDIIFKLYYYYLFTNNYINKYYFLLYL
uniref:Uncharacterized protein n=1 Tax=viral metagenome TaxID=1070528 RepID=A0A6C0H7K6_9ZZZZ